MSENIDLSQSCGPEQIDANYMAMEHLLDSLYFKNEITDNFKSDILLDLNCAEHTLDGQRKKVFELIEKTGLDIKDFDKEVKKVILTKRKKRIDKQWDESMPALKLNNFMDNVNLFWKKQPFFFDRNGIFWLWDGKDSQWSMTDETDIMNSIEKELGFYGETVTSSIKNNYMESFKRIGRNNIPKDSKTHWIQFKDKAFSLTSRNIYDVTPDFFFCNPINYEIGNEEETPVMDKLFEEWVGKDNIKTLYEIIAYCCYPSYPIQVLFCLYGNGRNGKSCFLRLLAKFIGIKNICSTELDLLVGNSSSRFEKAKLYKKLVCQMGETNFGVLTKSSILKQLTGGDMIGFELKNKNPFDDYNYAKILIASNSLPSSEDTSEGFYRRWVIIDFPNQFKEGTDILATVPEIEYNSLAKKVINILPGLIENGSFTNQGKIEERKHKYIMASNPLPVFLKICCEKEEGGFVSYGELYTAYVQFLKKHKKRRVKQIEFRTGLENEGFWVERTSKNVDGDFKSGMWIEGLILRFDWKEKLNDNYD